MTIGEYIKQRRKELHLSAEQIADYCGVNAATVYRWESGAIGDIPGRKIKALAEILKISPSIIVGSNDDDDIQEGDLKAPIILPEFKTAQEAIKFILEVPMVAQFGGYNLESMSDQELIDMANLVAQLIRGVAYTTTPDANDNNSDPHNNNHNSQ